jgi:multicomponent Na+:H+ antiporter subunit C
MELMLSILVGVLFGTALYTMLRRSIVRLAIGVTLLGHAANLLIFTVSGVSRTGPPIVEPGRTAPLVGSADPVPQALILTAIVISFGLLAFLLVLVQRVYQTVGSDDSDEMGESEA